MSFSILSIFKNESLNLDEWINHYILQNVKTLYLIDNGSTDQYQNILDKYKEKVKLFVRPERFLQDSHYNAVYAEILLDSNVSDWLFVVDIDEYVFCSSCTILEGLQKLPPNITEVRIPTRPFGSSGFISHPSGKIIESFIFREPEFLSYKSFFKIDSVKVGELGIHETTRDCKKFDGRNIFKLNHYLIQSFGYYTNRIISRGDVKYWWHKKTLEYFTKHDKNATVFDDELAIIKKRNYKFN
jgi:hypothetical protein